MTSEPKNQLARDYDTAAIAYERHWGPVLALLAENFLDRLALKRVKRILDVGAGTGRLVGVLESKTQATVVGVDRSEGMLRRAPADSLGAVMDAEQLAFADDSFGMAIAFFMLFHLTDPLQGLREMRRVVSTGGMVALMTWGDDDLDFRGFEVWDEILDRLGAAAGRALFSQHELTYVCRFRTSTEITPSSPTMMAWTYLSLSAWRLRAARHPSVQHGSGGYQTSLAICNAAGPWSSGHPSTAKT